jgi:hypothetical protein
MLCSFILGCWQVEGPLSEGSITNPFIYGRPVRPDEFFNRNDSLRTVFNRLRHAESTALVGEPHIGKSSMLLKIAEEKTGRVYLGQELAGITFCPLDLHPISNQYAPDSFWSEALEELEMSDISDCTRVRLNYVRQQNFSRRSLERLFNHLGQQDKKLVLLLDEFDRLLSHPGFRESNFFPLLRSLSTRTGGLVVIPASRLTVAEMNDRSRGLLETGSPYFNNIIEEKLGPFTDETIDHLLAQAPDLIFPEDRKVIDHVAGRHPFLVQAIAAALAEEEQGPERHARAVSNFYRRVSYHFDDLWYAMDDRTRATAVVLSLLGLGGKTLGQEFASESIGQVKELGPELQRLDGLGLARPVGEERPSDWQYTILWQGRQWTIGAQAFAWWVREVAITGVRPFPSFDEWLANERYRSLLSPEQWDWLLKTVREANRAQQDPVKEAHERSSTLREMLDEHFDLSEIEELCFDMQIDFENLQGTSKKTKILSLLNYCQRHSRVNELWNLCIQLRPEVALTASE